MKYYAGIGSRETPKNILMAGLGFTFLIAVFTLSAAPVYAQYDGPPYGGPPMWSRNRRDYEPPPRRYGPQFGPCIYYGDCGGPKWGDPYDRTPPGMPPFRLPPPPSRRYGY